jgi:hypothetical protein
MEAVRIGMSFAIRPLIKRRSGKCELCQSQVELVYLDSILAGRICQDCEPFLAAAESALVAADFWHPYDSLVSRNP